MLQIGQALALAFSWGKRARDEPAANGCLMTDLSGRRILVVEDEWLIAMVIENTLAELGCAVLGPARTLAAARAMINASPRDFDAVCLDVNLGGESSLELAAILQKRGIPFIFITGYDPQVLAAYEGHPIVFKPFEIQQLETALKSLKLDAR